jgi:glutamyl-tRNA reductase
VQLVISGLSHKTAPVELREALSFPPDRIGEALSQLLSYPSISESVILSTCNRTEIYAVATEIEEGRKHLGNFLDSCHDLKNYCLADHLYYYDSTNAVRHLFRVVSSLDSMVIGEAQILGQAKEAYSYAFNAEATRVILNRLFRQAFAVGKRVRTETDIGENAVSISYAAVQLAKKVFDSLEGKTVMVVGAGKMSELTVKHLFSNGVSEVIITNRSYPKARKMAKNFSGRAIKFEDRFQEMVKADIVISSTAAPNYVIEKPNLLQVMKKRRYQPIFLIDIAVPRDIDPSANEIGGLYLYDIDDLQSVVDSNLAQRSKEAKEAEKIINHEVSEFVSWMSSLEVVPTISELRQLAEKIRCYETEKALNKLGNLSDKEKNVIDALTNGIINKMLHKPMVKLKDASKSRDGYLYVDSIRHLFGLNDKQDVLEKKVQLTSSPKLNQQKREIGAS